MRFASYQTEAGRGVAAVAGDRMHGLVSNDPGYPGDLHTLIGRGVDALREAHARLLQAPPLDLNAIRWLPPLMGPGKILCVGRNYRDHAVELGGSVPDYPMIFARFPSILVGHDAPLVRPRASHEFDYEGELVAVIGRPGRHISRASALDHVAGYSLFNDGSLRDYQTRTSQFTLGKNFDGTGAFGPTLVTADEVPPGGRGLWLETRLNGTVMQRASTDEMIFDVAALIEAISEVMTLEAGDLIVTGTPSGVGAARTPPVFLTPGDLCEVEVTGLGILRNPVRDEVL
jgi:2-keto-4-pentenoate hydratase/2-oxohepta-3-ene-1,7-dioic acid hydratase in catechol pathway